jgi:hypothetical protein|tara:strand:+ start:79 stop:642 length:564 start_codon:yes stop_codon:yes gene_type:complete
MKKNTRARNKKKLETYTKEFLKENDKLINEYAAIKYKDFRSLPIKNYIKKNFNIEKFIKLINKRHKQEEFAIWYLSLEACENNNVNWNDITRKVGHENLYNKFVDECYKGVFLQKLNKNFKLEKIRFKEVHNDRRESYQLIKSNLDKTFYILIYKEEWYYNERTSKSYYVTKKFKEKNKAISFIKKR